MRTLVYLHVFFLFYAFCLVSGKVVSEKTILLEFKSSVSDPSGTLSSWSSDTPDHCSWYGVTCNSKSRVSELKIIGDACDRGNSQSNFYFTRSRRNCSSSSGKLVGKLLPLIGKLNQLRVLSLQFNEFSGEIPIEIWGLEDLEVLDLEGNLFTGKLVDQFDGLRKLRVFNLGFNRIHGRIPFSLSKCERLHVLNLAGNKVSGRIPRFLSGFVQLRELYLSFNQLTGNVIGQFGNHCAILESLDLSGNFLIGRIPSSLGKCQRLKRLLLSSNKLGGVIPFELGQLRNLEVLDLSSNSFSGEIPQNLVQLRNLSVLLLNNNKLSGKIPSGFSDMTSFTTFNVKYNYLTDPLLMKNDLINHGTRFRRMLSVSVSNPTLDFGNEYPQNYSPPSEVYASSRKNGLTAIAIASVVCASAVFSVLLALVAFFFYTRRWSPNSRVQVAESREITLFNDIGVPLTYEKIIEGTGCFHAVNCIGNGGFGATYKAEINARTLVAVKKLSVGRMQGVKHFHAEIKALETVKHPNLVTLIGYHASETEMFLIYNYFPGGNLENFIHKRPEASNWKIVHKIALHIAKGLAYLHEQCRVLHRDVKPSNILLDNDFNAYLSDFGLARLLGTSETHATTGVEGTFGYVAPEYALTCRVSEKSDVYSYGVVLLELISDKRALDPSFSSHANGFNIVSWADLLLRHGKGKDVFRTRLWESGPQNKMVEALHLAVRCTTESFTNRPTMKQVAWRMSQFGTPPS